MEKAEESVASTLVWDVVRPLNRDCLELVLARYTHTGNSVVAEYMDANGDWHEVPEGEEFPFPRPRMTGLDRAARDKLPGAVEAIVGDIIRKALG